MSWDAHRDWTHLQGSCAHRDVQLEQGTTNLVYAFCCNDAYDKHVELYALLVLALCSFSFTNCAGCYSVTVLLACNSIPGAEICSVHQHMAHVPMHEQFQHPECFASKAPGCYSFCHYIVFDAYNKYLQAFSSR